MLPALLTRKFMCDETLVRQLHERMLGIEKLPKVSLKELP